MYELHLLQQEAYNDIRARLDKLSPQSQAQWGKMDVAQMLAHVTAFGTDQLWIDRVPGMSQAEIWLELATPDVAAAAEHLKEAGVTRRDEIEPLGDYEGFWISSPASIIHMVAKPDHY
jgi:hypothetical protein